MAPPSDHQQAGAQAGADGEQAGQGLAGEVTAAEVVEEVMRLRGAATNVGRTVARPVDLGGERLEPGSRILFSLWSANRDERVYPRPDAFDPRANTEPHVAFGHGPHFCLGAALARAELQEALSALSARLHCPTVEPGSQWSPPMGINGPTVLPLRFDARVRR